MDNMPTVYYGQLVPTVAETAKDLARAYVDLSIVIVRVSDAIQGTHYRTEQTEDVVLAEERLAAALTEYGLAIGREAHP